jgi:hypothetical protein
LDVSDERRLKAFVAVNAWPKRPLAEAPLENELAKKALRKK